MSPKKKRVTPWTNKKSWEPEDHLDFALDPRSDWYDMTVEGDVYDAREWEDLTPHATSKEESAMAQVFSTTHPDSKKLRRTLRSVCLDCLTLCYAEPDLSCIATTSPILESALTRHLSRRILMPQWTRGYARKQGVLRVLAQTN